MSSQTKDILLSCDNHVQPRQGLTLTAPTPAALFLWTPPAGSLSRSLLKHGREKAGEAPHGASVLRGKTGGIKQQRSQEIRIICCKTDSQALCSWLDWQVGAGVCLPPLLPGLGDAEPGYHGPQTQGGLR